MQIHLKLPLYQPPSAESKSTFSAHGHGDNRKQGHNGDQKLFSQNLVAEWPKVGPVWLSSFQQSRPKGWSGLNWNEFKGHLTVLPLEMRENNQAIYFILDNYFIVGYLAKYQTHILNVDHPYSEPLYLPVTVSFFCVCVVPLVFEPCFCVSLCVRAVCLCPSCFWGVCLCLSWCLSRVSVSLLVLKPCVCVSQCSSRVSLSLFVLEPCVCVSLGARAVCLCLS